MSSTRPGFLLNCKAIFSQYCSGLSNIQMVIPVFLLTRSLIVLTGNNTPIPLTLIGIFAINAHNVAPAATLIPMPIVALSGGVNKAAGFSLPCISLRLRMASLLKRLIATSHSSSAVVLLPFRIFCVLSSTSLSVSSGHVAE